MRSIMVLLLLLAIYHKSKSSSLDVKDGISEVESPLFASEFQQLGSLSNIIEAELDLLARLNSDEASKEESAGMKCVDYGEAADEEAPDLGLEVCSSLVLLEVAVEGEACKKPLIVKMCPKLCAPDIPVPEGKSMITTPDDSACNILEVSNCKTEAIQELCPNFCAAAADVAEEEAKLEETSDIQAKSRSTVTVVPVQRSGKEDGQGRNYYPQYPSGSYDYPSMAGYPYPGDIQGMYPRRPSYPRDYPGKYRPMPYGYYSQGYSGGAIPRSGGSSRQRYNGGPQVKLRGSGGRGFSGGP